jgi:DNA-binding response OmpR family regulator
MNATNAAVDPSTPGVDSVLLVEDDPSIRRILRLTLRSGNFDVSVAETGAEALAVLKTRPVAAVILDLGLPDERGGEVLSWLRKHQAEEDGPPWIVVTALDEIDARKKYGPLGDYFLHKPFDPWKLLALLERLAPHSERSP